MNQRLAFSIVAAALAATIGRRTAALPQVIITPLVHSSIQIEGDGRVVQIDPWSKADLARAKPADLILITDDPVHHLDSDAIRRLRKPGARVLLPPASQAKFPEGTAILNGETRTTGGIVVEAIPAYDVKPGEPSHPKGKANGYLVTLAGQRIYVAGVTECVPEMRAQRNVDVAFVPMNLPLDRMTPAAAAACVNVFAPRAVYVYHYDQTWASSGRPMPNVSDTIASFRRALAPGIEFRAAVWYPY
jgi:L-ascorbate metabolism protein UlaG (beta-lactamase superfamily)